MQILMRGIFQLAILAVLSAAALPAQSWDEVRGITAGTKVIVTDKKGTTYKGPFRSATPEQLVMETKNGETSVQRADVKKVEMRSGSKRLRNTLIGVGIGTAVGLTIDQTLGARFRNETGNFETAAAYAGSIGLFGGIPAAMPAYRTVYKVR